VSRWSSALHAPHHSVTWPMPRPCSAASLAGSQMHGIQEIFCGIPGASECPYGQFSGLWAKRGAGIRLSCPELQVLVGGNLATREKQTRASLWVTYRERGGEYRECSPASGSATGGSLLPRAVPARLAAVLRMCAWRLARPGLDRRLRNRSCLSAYGTAQLPDSGQLSLSAS
jgi:hypothetical protein